jgi:hypothetical protein
MGPRRKNHLKNPLKSQGCVAFLTSACLFAGGCSSMKVKMGWRVDLNQTPISSIQASLPKGPAIAPGQKSPLVVVLTQPNGKVLFTEGQGAGKVMWKDLQVASTVVIADEKGNLSLPEDPRASLGKVGHVIVTVPSQPDLRAELDVPVRYDFAYVSDFSGRPGMSGRNGSDGLNGISGTSGSMDPNNPSPGGNGSDGTNGEDGKDGDPGGDAPPVDIRITLQQVAHPLLQVSVSVTGYRRLYLLDPQGGSLTVKADGGPAGSGGHGGRGGRGGSGGIGTPSGSDGRNGLDGRNGWDGPQGKGGLITVIYDPRVRPFLSVLHLSSRNGPAPLYREAPIASAW